MVFNATFNSISVILWWSVLLEEETGVPGENHRPVTSLWQTVSHNVVSSKSCHEGFELTTLVVIGTDCTGSCKSNNHTIMTAPFVIFTLAHHTWGFIHYMIHYFPSYKTTPTKHHPSFQARFQMHWDSEIVKPALVTTSIKLQSNLL
jgi:hypothetical protein